jgi:hypothetical protein
VKWRPLNDGLNLSASSLQVGFYCTGVPTSGYVLHSRDGRGTWNDRTRPLHCPYGALGDRLWVRETWADVTKAFQTHDCEEPKVIAFRADDAVYETEGMAFLEHRNDSGIVVHKWKPSIFLPRPFSRLSLEITNVRVERLQEITFSDIRAEGKKCPEHDFHSGFCASECAALRGEWATGWDKINGKRKDCDWSSNPWVWVIAFERAESEPRTHIGVDADELPVVAEK